MSWISKYLKEPDFQKIEDVIAEVEEQTSGEIVPVIVKKSSSVGHIPLTLTLIITLMLVIGEMPFSDWLWVRPWVWLWPLLILVIYLLSIFLARIFWVQKLFVPEKDEMEQVHQRACLEFYLNRVQGTSKRTGVLIFVSVMEKKAVILADEGISSKLPPETWNNLLMDFRVKLNEGQWVEGFTEAIRECGKLLKTHFPISDSSENQLKNHLVVKE